MKSLIICIVAILIIVSINAQAQLVFAPFLAKEGESVATAKAISLGYNNPKLIIIGSTTGVYQVGTFSVNLVFDLDSGKATLWTYMFISANKPDSMKVLAVISSPFPSGDKFIINEVTPDQLKGFPTPGKNPVTSNNWINSDLIMNKLKIYQNYLNFKNSCQGMVMKMLALGIYPDYPVPDKTKLYWMALVGNTTLEKYFFIDALTGDITEPVTSINVDNSTSIIGNSFPNPASHFVTINLNIELSNNISFSLFDQNGNLVDNNNFSINVKSNSILLNTEGLNSGSYFYKIINNNNLYNGSFVIIK